GRGSWRSNGEEMIDLDETKRAIVRRQPVVTSLPEETIQRAEPVAPERLPRPDSTQPAAGEIPAGPVVHPEIDVEPHVMSVDKFSLHYGKRQALHSIDMKIAVGKVTAMIGPSGCGKSTLLRSCNRLNDLIDHVRVEGNIAIDGQPIYA